MTPMFADLIQCRAPRPVAPLRCSPAPPWTSDPLPKPRRMPPRHLIGDTPLGLAVYDAKKAMHTAGENDAVSFIRHFDKGAVQVEERAGLLTWRSYIDYGALERTTWYLVGKQDIYIVEVAWTASCQPSVRGTIVPIDAWRSPASGFFLWDTADAPWFADWIVARQRLPKTWPRLQASLRRLFERNQDAVFDLISYREAHGTLDGGPRPQTIFDPRTEALIRTRSFPRIQYGRRGNEGYVGLWFTRLGQGWFVRDRSPWDVAYVFVGDNGVRYADSHLLQEIYDAFPDLWYEPLDETVQPHLYALARQQGEQQAAEPYRATEVALLSLLASAGKKSRTRWVGRSSRPAGHHV